LLALGPGCGGQRGDPLLIPPLAFGRLGLQQGLGVAQPRQPAGLGGQRLGELVPTGLAVLQVLALVGLGGLPQDLGSLALDLVSGVAGGVGGVGSHLGAIQGDHPEADQPSGGAQPQRLDQEPARACSCRTRNRAMVTWSGSWLPASTRKATSSWQRRSICREERTPMA